MSVVAVLGGAAVLGVVGGVLLARNAPLPEEELVSAERAASRVLPTGSATADLDFDPMEPDPISLRGIPPYPGARPRRISASRPGVGPLNAISWFSTTDSMDKVLGFYERVWSEAKLFHVSHRWERRGYVSWLERNRPTDGGFQDLGGGVLHMVSAMDEGSQTIVLLSATDPLAMLESVSPLPSGVRLPEGAGRPQVINLGEAGQQRTTVFSDFQRPLTEVAPELEDLMKSGGWTLEEKTVAAEGRVSLVARKADILQVAVVEGTGPTSQVLITLEQRPPSAPGVAP